MVIKNIPMHTERQFKQETEGSKQEVPCYGLQ